MNIQQLINTFSIFIDECSAKYMAILKNKDFILDRCYHLYDDEQGLYFSNTEIFGRSIPKAHFTNYFGINTIDTEHPRSFYTFVTLRFNNAKINTHSLDDVIRAIRTAQEKIIEDIPLYFYNGQEEYFVPGISFTEDGVLKLNDTSIENISQLAPHLSICGNATESEEMFKTQLDLLYQVFLRFNEQGE